MPHDDYDIVVIYLKSTENEEKVTQQFPCSFSDTVNFVKNRFHVSDDVPPCDKGPDHLTQPTSSKVRITVLVIQNIHTF